MNPLLKIMLILASIFASTFIIIKSTGLISIEIIENWLIQAKLINRYYVAAIIILILFADLFIAVPTLTVIILSGYFLGFTHGALMAILGVSLAGSTGYYLSYQFGDKLLKHLIKNTTEKQKALSQFRAYGFVMILLSRAAPILPEVTACMAGTSKMPRIKFMTAWLLASVPYTLIAAYAGSISTIQNPKPAIFTAIGLSLLLWISWFVFNKYFINHSKLV
ncbi:VTT domain-containing protein [Pseudoalteromonas sp. C2R02]|nr:VTT domain-containing protein [Pseudoalteromonas sp. C2R02]